MNTIRPWLRIVTNPPILRRALVTSGVVGVLLTVVNHGDQILGGHLGPDHVWPIAFTFIVPFVVATITSAGVIRRPGNGVGRVLPLQHEVEAAGTFPDSKPNPVLRLAASGVLLYANPASAPLIRALGVRVGDAFHTDLAARLRSAVDAAATGAVQLEAAGRIYRLKAVAIDELGFINVHGTEVTQVEADQASAV